MAGTAVTCFPDDARTGSGAGASDGSVLVAPVVSRAARLSVMTVLSVGTATAAFDRPVQ